MRIRRLEANEQALFRELRLRALADAPDAFGEALADALVRPDSYRANLTRSVTDPTRHVMFVAEDGTTPVGLVFGLRDVDRADAGRRGGMWVAPEVRGRGLGRALAEAVMDWTRGCGFTRVALWVTAGDDSAVRLYERLGFEATGRRDALPSNPTRATVEMAFEPVTGAPGF